MLLDLPLLELPHRLKKKTVSPADLLQECFSAIDIHQPILNALITQADRASLLKSAAALTIDHPLSGLPYIIKDGYLTAGLRTTAASNVLKNYIPQYSATLVNRLNLAGALIVGKSNMDAWGH